MKRFLLLPFLVLAGATLAVCSPCGPGTLASFIGLGASGCTVGGTTLYDFQTLSGTTGATEIAPTAVSISPLDGGTNPGLSIAVNASAAASELMEAIFTYRIAGGSYGGSAITLGNSSETGDGAVTDTQNFCAGGTFGLDGVSGCSGTPGTLLALDGVQNSDSIIFRPVSLLSITDDLVFDGGTMGSAAGGTASDQFAAVPEPASLWLMALAAGIAARLQLRAGTQNLAGK